MWAFVFALIGIGLIAGLLGFTRIERISFGAAEFLIVASLIFFAIAGMLALSILGYLQA